MFARRPARLPWPVADDPVQVFWLEAISEAFAADLIDTRELESLTRTLLSGAQPHHPSLPAYAPLLTEGMAARGEMR